MTRAEVSKQVMSRVPADRQDVAEKFLGEWLALYPQSFRFGPESVKAGVRLVMRKLNEVSGGKS